MKLKVIYSIHIDIWCYDGIRLDIKGFETIHIAV